MLLFIRFFYFMVLGRAVGVLCVEIVFKRSEIICIFICLYFVQSQFFVLSSVYKYLPPLRFFPKLVQIMFINSSAYMNLK